ncbi:MAG: DUF2239 family protein [Pseudomonadota bacterium]|nr:DUF2239 family protein [Pseudomonadota bacterium]
MSGTVSAFLEDALIAQGSRETVMRRIEARYTAGDFSRIRVFEDATGRVIDLEHWDAGKNAAERTAAQRPPLPGQEKRARGRPKLGVTSREITLLPRQWDWLATQPGGASATIRRLIEEARKRRSESVSAAQAREGVHRFMTEMAGDRPGYEEALRALYRSDIPAVLRIASDWPDDIRRYLERLLDREVV